MRGELLALLMNRCIMQRRGCSMLSPSVFPVVARPVDRGGYCAQGFRVSSELIVVFC
jgi:hypothetical protein